MWREHERLCQGTLNLINLDPEIDLDVVADKPRPVNYRYSISNFFGFGSHKVALVFGRYS